MKNETTLLKSYFQINDKIMVSIIVPVYNTERYIEKCLTSIINQSYQAIEIIIVNDGSTDNSLNICNNFEIRDQRIRVFSHYENKGLSCALNTGLDNATGDFLMFVDSDDWIDPNGVEYLMNLVNKHPNVDFIRSYNRKVFFNNDIKEPEVNSLETLIDKGTLLNNHQIGGFVSSIFVRRNVVENNKLRFNVDLQIKMDYLFNWQCVLNCKNIIVSQNVFYNYCFRSTSLINTNSFTKSLNHLRVSELVYEYSKPFWGNKRVYSTSREYLLNGLEAFISSLMYLTPNDKLLISQKRIRSIIVFYIKKHKICLQEFKIKQYLLLIITLVNYTLINKIKAKLCF